jgi:phosphotransferase system  glucose/maltose/N-acetylglucosamine-specific IIC component
MQKQVWGWFLASAISAFVVGVTEPIEFAFMFVAPVPWTNSIKGWLAIGLISDKT